MFAHAKARLPEINLWGIVTFALFVGLGTLPAMRPVATLVFLASVVAFGALVFLTRRLQGMKLWHGMVITALAGYIVLGYGFANLAFHLGAPLIVGHGLMFGALALVFFKCRAAFNGALREPAVRCVLVLIAFTLLRLLVDIPAYGLYAVRDASLFVEGIFSILGFVWATQKRSVDLLLKSLTVIFILNMIYCCSYPWGQVLTDWSPKSGIFLEVPLLGDYGGNDVYLLSGALFCLLVGRYAVPLPRWVFLFLSAVQLLGLAIFQARAMYLGLAICLVLLLAFGEVRKCAQLTTLIFAGFVVILLVTSVAGLELSGRVGPVNLDFLKEHAESLMGDPNAPAAGTIDSRVDWYDDVLKRITSSSTTLIAGDGFGRPLIDFSIPGGVVVRQPHNSNLTVLARLGAIGFAFWAMFHIFILKQFVGAFLARGRIDSRMFAVILWLFLFYILIMIDATVQPGLEFSNGAITFYFIVGFALGLIRTQIRGTATMSTRLLPASLRTQHT